MVLWDVIGLVLAQADFSLQLTLARWVVLSALPRSDGSRKGFEGAGQIIISENDATRATRKLIEQPQQQLAEETLRASSRAVLVASHNDIRTLLKSRTLLRRLHLMS